MIRDNSNARPVLHRRSFIAGALVSLGLGLAAPAAHAQTEAPAEATEQATPVAAAWDLQFALPEIAEAFLADTGEAIEISFGLCNELADQIRKGAPFQIYLSADENSVLNLARDGMTPDRGVVYGIGRIALIVPNGSRLKPDGSLSDLRKALGDRRLVRLAIPNPKDVIFGKRAEQALRKADLWDQIQPYLVLGQTGAQAAELAVSVNVSGGIVGYPLALSNKIAGRGTIGLIPEDKHAPLLQRMVRLNDAGVVAQEFYSYLQQPAARVIFRKHGFFLPEELR